MGVGGMRKATSGIMGPWPVKAHSFPLLGSIYSQKICEYIDPARWCVVVGSPSPGRAVAAKGIGVH